jgi:uridylate kinase
MPWQPSRQPEKSLSLSSALSIIAVSLNRAPNNVQERNMGRLGWRLTPVHRERIYGWQLSPVSVAVIFERLFSSLCMSSAPGACAMSLPKFKRVLLKLSGESLKGTQDAGLDTNATLAVCQQLKKEVVDLGVQLAIVVGGGNIMRGQTASRSGMDRATADSMGMLATVINALALQDCLESIGVPARVMTAIEMRNVAEPFVRKRAVHHLDKGRVVIFGAGTGNPYFSTDTASALRASEIKAEVILKATKVDGIYSADPHKVATATRYATLTFQQALEQRLEVMDTAAFALCRENRIPVVVFNFGQENAMAEVISGNYTRGTLVTVD